MTRLIYIFSSILLMTALSACGKTGGDDTSKPKPPIAEGRLVSGSISGLYFESGDESGVTGALGVFTYEEGAFVTFWFGDVEIGTAHGAPTVTPMDFVDGGSSDSVEVQNIVSILLLLDEDGDANNGLRISDAALDAVESITLDQVDFSDPSLFTQPAVTRLIFELNQVDIIEHELVSREQARAHLEASVLCNASGIYSGTFDGADRGSFLLGIDPTNGNIGGHGYSNSDREYFFVDFLDGEPLAIEQDLGFVSGNVSTGATFEGSLLDFERLRGTWENRIFNDEGTFRGVSRGLPDETTLYRFTAVYFGNVFGNDFGMFVLNVDAEDNITGAFVDGEFDVWDVFGSVDGTTFVAVSESGAMLSGDVYKTAAANPLDDQPGLVGDWSADGENGFFFGAGCQLN